MMQNEPTPPYFRASLPIRVTILTGFLGAGKTTRLNALLADPAVTDTAVIVNEFGEAGIDHLLVETARDDVIELADGCICCTVRGDLVDTLADLVDRIQTGRLGALRRVIVETTGLADPTPILCALMGHPALVAAYALDGVVAVVDALGGAANLRTREEARRQVAVADRIVVTKTDLSPQAFAPLVAALRAVNPRAPILDAASGEARAALLLDCGLYDPATKSPDVLAWLQEERAAAGDGHATGTSCNDRHRGHDHGDDADPHLHEDRAHAAKAHGHGPSRHGDIVSFSLIHDTPIPENQIESFVDLLLGTVGDRLLRMKAVVHTVETPERPLVLHGVRRYLHPPARLGGWPAGTRAHTRLVLIGEGLDEAYVRHLFSAFVGIPEIDRPDRAALTDNPLALPGFPR